MGLTEWVQRLFKAQNALDQMDLALPKRNGNTGEEGEDNPLMFQFFQWDTKGTADESWWIHFAKQVPKMSELGVSLVWLPPPNKAMENEGRGYDAYDLWDLGEFNQKQGVATRWGTKAELLDAVTVAKNWGVGVLVDAVLNHKIGADGEEQFQAVPVDPQNRNRPIGEERAVSAWTKFTFPGRMGKYSTFQWSHEHFTGIDWDSKAREKGVFRITGKRRRGWNDYVSRELGNYDYLLGADVDHLHPEVRKDMKAWGPWVLETTGSVGFRLDAVKHFDYRFLSEFVAHVRKQPGRERLFSVAEFWSSDAKELDRYARRLTTPIAMFDAALHYNFHRASLDPNFDLRRILKGSLVEFRSKDSVTFVENHDTVPGQSLESPVSIPFKTIAYAIILLRPYGFPCVFHADVYGPTIVPDLEKLMIARKQFAYGACEDTIVNSDSPQVIAWIRRGTLSPGKNGRPGCLVVCCNAKKRTSEHVAKLNLGKRLASSVWYDFLGYGPKVEISSTGFGTFPAANTVCVYVQKLE